MDLHALTSKPETPAELPETPAAVAPVAEPAPEISSAVVKPVDIIAEPVHETDLKLETPEPETVPEPVEVQPIPANSAPSAAEGEKPMSTETTPTKNQSIHDAIFWEVHFIVLYYIILIALTGLVLLNVWGGDLLFLKQIGLTEKAIADPFLRTVGYTVVGSVFGSILYNIRVLFNCYLKKKNYDSRWLGKYISAPWESAAMSVVVLTLVRGGAALFGGVAVAAPPTPTNNFASFSMGALVGFGMRDVVLWVQALVETTFGSLTKTKPAEKEQPDINE